MPEYLHLPPVAQAVAVLIGVALAVIRLLTASKAFWWQFPEWLQKGLPAALVAVGLLPKALENAQSWVDVVQALLLSVGAWFTASRGDQRPVEPPKSKSPPGDTDTTVSIMPEPVKLVAQDRSRLHNDRPDEPAGFRGWDWRPALLVALTLSVVTMQLGCPAPKPPCNEDKMRAIDKAYLVELGKACLQYPSAADCPEYPALRAKHESALEACPQ